MNVTECLKKITSLTEQNLELLKTINDSFYTKRTSLSVNYGENRYKIPSFISLENKYNHLQDAFNNLVHAPESGEAWYNFDGNSKEIYLRSYQAAPNSISLENVKLFEHEETFPFKDLMSPSPYINIDLSEIPDDITAVRVKKIILYNETLITSFQGYMEDTEENPASALIDWTTANALILSGDPAYVSGSDYLEYNKIYDLPTRTNTCSGEYIITEIVDDTINEDGIEIITVKISTDNSLVYTLFDGTTEKDLEVGDILTTYDGACMFEIDEIFPTTNELALTVSHAEYVNLHAASDAENAGDYSKLRIYRPQDFKEDKYIHIPLEEDEYVYIAIAPLNSRMNTQSNWGTGLFLDTYKLTDSEDGTDFHTYYTQNVSNIGDMIIELSNIYSGAITRFTESELETFTELVPTLSEDTIQVVQINKHLNDSETVQNIRSLYSQKKQYNTDITEISSKINALTSELAEISFDDTSGVRTSYEDQITKLKAQRADLQSSVTKIVDEIATAANDSEIPIENAKYRIRGYVDIESILSSIWTEDWLDYLGLVRGVQIRYRYKNSSNPQANVDTINDFLFTEWTDQTSPSRTKNMSYADGAYSTSWSDADENGLLSSENVPKFNQIDIPITQGESVDIKIRLVWDFGYPFSMMSSQWSEILNVEFPEELIQDVEVTTIIEENNDDVEENRFNSILEENGILDHISDEYTDQDITYSHSADTIASGFYTEERRVIPLKDKLEDMVSAISEIQDTIGGTFADIVTVKLTVGTSIYTLAPDIDNQISLPAYSNISSEDVSSGSVILNGSVAELTCTLAINNDSDSHTVNIFSLFPGSRDVYLSELAESRSKYDLSDFYESGSEITEQGVAYLNTDSEDDIFGIREQRCNQFLVFRLANPFTSQLIWDESSLSESEYSQTLKDQETLLNTTEVSDDESWVFAAPLEQTDYQLCIDSDSTTSKVTIAPGGSLNIPIIVRYYMESDTSAEACYQMGFNIRNSLYTDPLYYQFTFNARYAQTILDSTTSNASSITNSTVYNVTIR